LQKWFILPIIRSALIEYLMRPPSDKGGLEIIVNGGIFL
jgi:hypothetical protein